MFKEIPFREIYPTPHTGSALRAKDQPDWAGIKGDESRLVRCKFCGFINDPERDKPILKKGSFAGKGINFGAQKTSTLTYPWGKTETIYYYESSVIGGCAFCGSFLYK